MIMLEQSYTTLSICLIFNPFNPFNFSIKT